MIGLNTEMVQGLFFNIGFRFHPVQGAAAVPVEDKGGRHLQCMTGFLFCSNPAKVAPGGTGCHRDTAGLEARISGGYVEDYSMMLTE